MSSRSLSDNNKEKKGTSVQEVQEKDKAISMICSELIYLPTTANSSQKYNLTHKLLLGFLDKNSCKLQIPVKTSQSNPLLLVTLNLAATHLQKKMLLPPISACSLQDFTAAA